MTIRYLRARVAGKEIGVPAEMVAEVLRGLAVRPVPFAPSGVAGLASLRGRIVAAFDLGQLTGIGASAGAMHVIVQAEEEALALAVDAVLDIVDVAPSAVDSLAGERRAFQGLAGRMLLLEREWIMKLGREDENLSDR